MEVGNSTSGKRVLVWNAIIEFLCYEYCADYISSSDTTHSGFQWRITSEILQELNEYQLRENDLPSLHQTLTQFLMISNKLLEENFFGDKKNIEECIELLEELCNISSKLKTVGEHLNKLLKDIKSQSVHNTKEEIEEWRNVFVGSRTILVREVLEFLPQPYLLKMDQNCSLDYIMQRDKGVTAAVALLKSVNFKAKDVWNVKKALKDDELILHVMKNNSTNHNHNKVTSSSPEDSYETATSEMSTIAKMQNTSRKISKQMQNHRANEMQLRERNTRQNSKESKLITSSYFTTPYPVPKLRNRSQSLWTKDFSEMKKPSSPVSSIITSRSQSIGSRKRLPWTYEEEELLVLGVEKYNVGKWKFILLDGGLENRTVRDLYDKWKNIQKYGHLDSIKARLQKKVRKK